MNWVAGFNQPGYLPESDPEVFDNYLDAVEYLRDELGESMDDVTEYPEAEYDKAQSDFQAMLPKDHDVEWSWLAPDGYAYWVMKE